METISCPTCGKQVLKAEGIDIYPNIICCTDDYHIICSGLFVGRVTILVKKAIIQYNMIREDEFYSSMIFHIMRLKEDTKNRKYGKLIEETVNKIKIGKSKEEYKNIIYEAP